MKKRIYQKKTAAACNRVSKKLVSLALVAAIGGAGVGDGGLHVTTYAQSKFLMGVAAVGNSLWSYRDTFNNFQSYMNRESERSREEMEAMSLRLVDPDLAERELLAMRQRWQEEDREREEWQQMLDREREEREAMERERQEQAIWEYEMRERYAREHEAMREVPAGLATNFTDFFNPLELDLSNFMLGQQEQNIEDPLFMPVQQVVPGSFEPLDLSSFMPGTEAQDGEEPLLDFGAFMPGPK